MEINKKEYEFEYNGKAYILMEGKVPNKKITHDVIIIFEMVENQYKYINYFYGSDVSYEEMVSIAKCYIKEEN